MSAQTLAMQDEILVAWLRYCAAPSPAGRSALRIWSELYPMQLEAEGLA